MRRQKIVFLFLLSVFFLQCKQEDTYKQGKALYLNNCAACHMDDGTGLGALIPPLAQSDFLQKNNKKLACIIRNGIADTIMVNGVKYTEKMNGLKKMTPESMVNVINYINKAWGNNIPFITLKEVNFALKSCAE